MVDEDVAGLARVIMGEDVERCELCGRVGSRSSLVRLEGRPSLAEPVEALRVCAECHAQIQHAEVPFDAEIGAGLQAADSDE